MSTAIAPMLEELRLTPKIIAEGIPTLTAAAERVFPAGCGTFSRIYTVGCGDSCYAGETMRHARTAGAVLPRAVPASGVPGTISFTAMQLALLAAGSRVGQFSGHLAENEVRQLG